ncbi:MAG: SMC family ATPase [candidate division Zixibacteria bacterium]|nr:SMC family ATPase [candidate division Zixibacteria bacterium]MDH3937226.1 SMC family ATPase [candidate division Zixibacteria bacterium]
MRLLSLDINNFRVIRKATLPLPDRVIGVIGPNGAGKSSLVEAIAWVLYGNQAARSGKDEIKSQFAGAGENCEVTLDFEVNDVPYKVTRRLVGRKEKAEVELFRGEAAESVGVNETRQYVGQLLGLDFKGFLTSFLARQQELNALSDLQPSKRRDHLAGMLGIERLDRGIIKLKEDLRLESRQIEFMEQQLSHRTNLAAEIERLTTHLGQLSGRQVSIETGVRNAEAAVKSVSDRAAQLQDTKSQWTQLTAQIQAEQGSLTSLEQRQADLQKEADKLAKMKTQAKTLAGTLQALPKVRRELEKHKAARSSVDVRKQIITQLEAARSDLKNVTGAIELGQGRLKSTKAKLKAIPADVAEQLKQTQSNLEDARTSFSRLKATRDSLATQADKLTRQVGQVDRFGPDSVCDRCHRPLGEDLPTIRKHLIEELDSLKKQLAEHDRDLLKQEKGGGQLKKQWSELDRQTKTRYEAEVDRIADEKEQATLEKRKTDLTTAVDKLTEQLAQTAEVTLDEEAHTRLSEQLAQLEEGQNQRQLLLGKLDRLPVVSKESTETKTKLNQAAGAIDKLNARLTALNYDQKAADQVATELVTAQEHLDKARGEQYAHTKDVEITQSEMNEKLRQKQALEKAEAELEEHQTSRYHREKLGLLMAEFRQHLITRIRPRLADLSSGLFSDMTGGKYSMVELDEKYNLRVWDSGQFFGVERFSGGEKDLANLCLRLAISLALTESAGLSRSFVILDEVFGSQDNERKELIIGALGSLKNRFPQLLLITHVEDIRDRVEELIEVRPTSQGYSEVIVNEVAVG